MLGIINIIIIIIIIIARKLAGFAEYWHLEFFWGGAASPSPSPLYGTYLAVMVYVPYVALYTPTPFASNRLIIYRGQSHPVRSTQGIFFSRKLRCLLGN